MKRISVRAILRDNSDNICLIHRIKKGEEYWVAPGGGVEAGEDLICALRREILEEIGSTIVLDDDTPVFSYEEEQQIHHYFSCKEVSRTTPKGDEHTTRASSQNVYDINFVKIDRINALELVPKEIKNKFISAAQSSLELRK